MEIRRVQDQDIAKVKVLADSLVVTSESRDKNYGFYEYSLTNEQYVRRSESSLFFVGLNNSQLEGFCMAYDLDFVKRLIEQEPSLRENEIFRYLVGQQEDFIYIDQLAVRKPKSFVGATCACGLFDKIISKSKGKASIQGIAPHSPWKNESSIGFFTHQGAKFVKEIKGSEGIVFGAYRLNL